MELTAKIVNETFLKCLFENGENTDNHVIGEGVMTKVGFNPVRLKENKKLIIKMLEELSDDFMVNGGGGMSFLNMSVDKNGNEWTGLHKTMDELVCLGNAIGRLGFVLPKELWSVLPGGMPYIVIYDKNYIRSKKLNKINKDENN